MYSLTLCKYKREVENNLEAKGDLLTRVLNVDVMGIPTPEYLSRDPAPLRWVSHP